MVGNAANWVGLDLAGGRYRVAALLGEGGMGLVYRALDFHLDADVVIKVPRRAALAEADFGERFAREIRSLVRLAHPHIVKVNDFGSHDGYPFAVMQYLSGGSLKDRQPTGADGTPLPVPPEELGSWLEEAAAALDFIHQQKYIHRDVKPTNILFDAHGNAYLSDFGLAKVMAAREVKGGGGLTGAGIVLGTAEYIAPELIMGQPCDGRADQYALAVTVFELLSGHVPFQGPTPTAILVKHTVEKPPALYELRPGLSRALSLVVLRALAKDPAQRYESCTAFAQALLAALRPALEAEQKMAGPTVSPERPERTRVPCPNCHKAFDVPARAVGKRLRCPACRAVFAAPPAAAQGATDTGARVTAPAPALPNAPPAPVARMMLEQNCWFGHQGPVQAVAFAPDGRLALSGSADATVRLWEVASAQEHFCFTGHRGAVNCVAFSTDGYFALSGGADGTVRLWNVETGRELHRFIGSSGAVQGVAFSPDSSRVLSAGQDGTLRWWDVETGHELRRLTGDAGGVLTVAYARDGRRALSGGLDGTVRLWDLDTGRELRQFTGHDGQVSSVAFSSDGRWALSGGQDRSVRLWDVDSGREIRSLRGHINGVSGVAFFPDGERAISASLDNTLKVWDIASGTPLGSCLGHKGAVLCAACSADGGHIISGGADQTVRLWSSPRR
jgi:tRNA A-37 threonylcarbamoyl transferase component Bud32